MNIIIIGGGKVGSALIHNLVPEEHNIVIIDINPAAVDNLITTYDILGVSGHGASITTLKEAGASKANLVVAVTHSDELNILCCLTAKMLGTKHTIARVRDPEYSRQLSFVQGRLGISMLVNPEYEAASEIARMLRFPSAIKIDTFAKGRVDLAEIKLSAQSPLVGKPLYSLTGKNRVLVCAAQRDGEVIIPNGDFIPLEGDRLHITAAHKQLAACFRNAGLAKKAIRSAMIVGGGKISYYLALQLLENGISLKIIESDEKRARELNDMLPGATVIVGDGTDNHLLLENGIDAAQAFIALTNIDEENLILSLFAESRGVHKVVAKVNRLHFNGVLARLGVESVISPKNITANMILRYVRGKQNSKDRGVKTLYKIANDAAEALEVLVGEGDDVVGIPLRDLPLKPNVLIACIIRKNSILYPGGDHCILAGDSVIVITTDSATNDIDDILKR